jgi:hypothetical protein
MLGELNFYVARVGVFLIPVALVVGMAGFDAVGAGPFHPPFQNSPPQNLEIRTWYDLHAIRNNLGGNHTLMNDLDFTSAGYDELASLIANQGKGWQPIGFAERICRDSPCGGGGRGTEWHGPNSTFDGQGYEIRDLFINRPNENDVGLFGVVNEGGIIKDISAVNVTVIGESYVAGLVGENRGTVSNSYSSGNVNGYQGLGGLVGTMESSRSAVSNSYSTCNVIGSSAIGGLVGIDDRGTVNNSFWDVQTSGQTKSASGTGKTTVKMRNLTTYSGAGWNIVAVANPGTRNPSYTWNIVNGETYPFLSWQPVS